jgi:hypothetical protein
MIVTRLQQAFWILMIPVVLAIMFVGLPWIYRTVVDAVWP